MGPAAAVAVAILLVQTKKNWPCPYQGVQGCELAAGKRIQVQETQINGALNRFNYLPAPEFLVKLKGGINSHWGYARKDVTLFNVGLPLPLPQFPICVRHMWDFKSII